MAEQHGKTLVPQIRFAGFTDPWEQRKFADFAVASGIRNRDNLPLRSYSVSNDRGFVPQDEQFENGGTMREADKSAYWIVEPGSFAYNPARINVGSIGYLAANESVIVSSLYEVFQTNGTCDDRFLWHWFKSPLFMKQIEMLQEGGVRLYFFFDKLLQSEIQMPGAEEQRRIGAFFDRLDSLITLHQRKYDKLCVLKKSMLDKMFPKGGSLYPEIRFAGFTDPWEQRKLGEVADNIDTGRSVFCSESYGRYPVLGSTSVIGSDSSYDYEGAFLLTARVGANAGNLYRFAGKVKISDNTVFLQAPNSDFLFYLLSHFDLRKLSFGTGQPLVRASELRAVEIDVPKSENEQKSIAEFLDRLDSLITLHQRKYCGVASWMLGVALVRLGSESDGAFGEMKHVLQ